MMTKNPQSEHASPLFAKLFLIKHGIAEIAANQGTHKPFLERLYATDGNSLGQHALIITLTFVT